LYGIDVAWVREIRPFAGATPVYGLPAFWVGLTALRGQLYAVLDLQLFLSPQPMITQEWQQVVFTAVNDFAVALLVAEMMAVRQPVDRASITAVSLPEAPYICGVTADQISLLDLAALFADPSLGVPDIRRLGD
jgi:chemotaxis signal transduction protein